MQDGFLGFKTSFMLDFVTCALVIVVPVLLFSIVSVRSGRRYRLHRRLQLLLGIILLAAVTAFEVDLQLLHGGWENIVAKSQTTPEALQARVSEARPWLWIHLIFAVTTPFLWLATIILAIRRFSPEVTPNNHSRLHKRLGWLSTIDITLTSVTGLIFYYVAFVR